MLLEKPMYFLAFSIVKNEADSAEIVSEAICRAYKGQASLKRISAFKPWILRIVHNTAVEFVRKSSGTVYLDEIEITQSSDESGITTKISLRQAVESLKPVYRTAILLYYYEDFSVAEISEITGVAPHTVKQRLSRARKQLREILKEDFANE